VVGLTLVFGVVNIVNFAHGSCRASALVGQIGLIV
jgi:branched-subunit amino acid ABC-type transport system permease component